MHSAESRLNRARKDLAKAERNLERVEQYEPGVLTSRADINEMVEKARERVSRLTIRVRIREAAISGDYSGFSS